ncbi:MAG: NADH:flavin oxidoreductase [Rhodospirillaceae bacterium]|nr:NADH:flavin oxidoreductase [Rhodospirillaceae bacterium]|tara:strand:- start:6455 stop:8527 length:2073 start_codon:yes stop_codon:yes gene_type:complete
MTNDPRYDVLFEPVKIGPVTAKNRFYQVPHCTGMGYDRPATLAAMRGVKAEGGWGVVNTEYTSIHPTADDAAFPTCSLWDEDDVRTMAVTADAIHEHGALAGTQLWHGGLYSGVKLTREVPVAPSGRPIGYLSPLHARTMDKTDIRELRRWQVDAAKRAQRAGFDIVYVYAGHAYLPAQFISRRFNKRSDEYGGSLENRVRLIEEMIADTKEAVGDTCAVAIRFSIDELVGEPGLVSETEGREVVEMLADLPDLWDVNIADYRTDSGSSRFFEEGFQEIHTKWVKPLTSKPVVGVGRYTSPDRMVSLINKGALDMIGAARPSIADPFLPKKVEEGRIEDIRECIGCNICRAAFKGCVPIRCTQNPTMGEEWRSGWHPEVITSKASDDAVLVVGAGPAGLEASRALGQRGYAVTLAEAGTDLGGHVARIAQLPGLTAWKRATDWRIGQIEPMTNVEIYRDSRLSADDVMAFDFPHVVMATGCSWVRDGTGRSHIEAIPGHDQPHVFSADDLLDATPDGLKGPVVVYDDDHYAVAGALAERLSREGHDVTLMTPAPEASVWTLQTDEHHLVMPRLHEAGVAIATLQRIESIEEGHLVLRHVQSGAATQQACGSLVLVTSRTPNDGLYQTLQAQTEPTDSNPLSSITAIGDCLAPGLIVDAIYAGHRFAREFQAKTAGDVRFRRERVVLGAEV